MPRSCGIVLAMSVLATANTACSRPVPQSPHPASSSALASGRDDKVLSNVKGSVSYRLPGRVPDALALHAMIPLGDDDYAVTGNASAGSLTLPDSSVISIGESTKIQLAFFNQAESTSAKFVLYDGTIRFAIHHPQGAGADYRFDTPTGTIAVRGTEGDIGVHGGTLQVNVYEVTDPAKPVTVTLKTGKTYALVPGKTLAAHTERGRPVAEVRDLSPAAMTHFNRQFGQPRGVTPAGKPRHRARRRIRDRRSIRRQRRIPRPRNIQRQRRTRRPPGIPGQRRIRRSPSIPRATPHPKVTEHPRGNAASEGHRASQGNAASEGHRTSKGNAASPCKTGGPSYAAAPCEAVASKGRLRNRRTKRPDG